MGTTERPHRHARVIPLASLVAYLAVILAAAVALSLLVDPYAAVGVIPVAGIGGWWLGDRLFPLVLAVTDAGREARAAVGGGDRDA